MNTLQKRQKIHDYVDQADDRFLNLVHSMIEADTTNIAGYRPDGSSISKENLSNRARMSMQQIEEGETVSAADFKKEFEAWKGQKRKATK